ncbi:hypothetical protein QMN58_26485 [Escherichia coli]|nr:hypothetical protein [Escherichia coli]
MYSTSWLRAKGQPYGSGMAKYPGRIAAPGLMLAPPACESGGA